MEGGGREGGRERGRKRGGREGGRGEGGREVRERASTIVTLVVTK